MTPRNIMPVLFGMLAVPLLLSLAAAPLHAQEEALDPRAEDREAVRRAVLDYVEAIYETAPGRITRSVSPELAKIGYYKGRDDPEFRADSMSYEELLETARTYNRSGRDLSGAPRLITVFDVLDRIATAKLVATWGVDYFHLEKVEGRWRIRHVVWQSHTPETVAAARAAMAEGAGGTTTRDVAIHSDAGPLAGTLHLPAGPGPHPAVVMVQGAGDRGRDEWPYRSVAEHLAANGYAALVYDKRGLGSSAGEYDEAEDLYVLAGDAISAFAAARAQPEIDAGRVGFWGRSQGAWIVAAAADAADAPAFVILEVGGAVTGFEQNLFARQQALEARGVAPDDRRAVERVQRAVWTYYATGEGEAQARAAVDAAREAGVLPAHGDAVPGVREGSPLPGPEWVERESSGMLRWFRRHLTFDPVPHLRNLEAPVMAVFGSADRLTPTDASVARLRSEAFADSRDRLTIRVFEGADHLLCPETPGEVAVMDCEFVDGYPDVLVEWLEGVVPDEPGRAARLFAPGVVSTGGGADELQPSMSADGRSLYFVRRVPGGRFTLHVTHRDADEGDWGAPEVLPFSGSHGDQEPFISADGRRLYFTTDRPAPGNTEPNRGRVPWVVERHPDGTWSQPRPLAPELVLARPADSDLGRFWGQPRGPVEGPDGMLYFWAERPDTRGHTDLYRVARVPGGFGEPVNLGAPVSSAHYETGVAFAPDGSWMIFGRDEADDGFGLGDLYVSERTGEGWAEPRNLGPLVNSPAFDSSPAVSSDGESLLFSSNRQRPGNEQGRHDIYVVPLSALGLGP